MREKISIVNKINIVIDCPDAAALAGFYQKFLGWELSHPPNSGWAALTSPAGMVIAFQEVENYQPPVWPWRPGLPGQMLHLDFWVDDLETGVRHALECGAVLAENQYFTTSRTMFDPAGHPFCIDTETSEP